MSAIVDALRRARTGQRSAPGSPRPVPAGLMPAAAPDSRPRAQRLRGAVVLPIATAGVALWAVVQLYSARSPQPAPDVPAPSPEPPRPHAVQEMPATPPATPPVRTPRPVNEPQPAAVTASAAPVPVEPRPRERRSTAAAPQPPSPAVAAPIAPAAVAPEPAPPTPGGRAGGDDHFGLALRHHALGNFEQALRHYMAVLQQNEFHVEARNNLGLLYHQRGLAGEAIEQFRQALLIDPQYLKARSNLAVVLTGAGRLAEARAELRAALAAEPRNVDLLVNMALVEKADRQPDQAIEVLLRALAVRSTHPAANYNLAVLYEEKSSLGLAYDHYATFLKHAGPEHGALLSDVQGRLEAIAPSLGMAPRP